MFNRREATVVSVGNNGLTCNVPPGDVVGAVPVQVFVPHRITQAVFPGVEDPLFLYVAEPPNVMAHNKIAIQSGAGMQANGTSGHAVAYQHQQGQAQGSRHQDSGTSLSNCNLVSRQVKHRHYPSRSSMTDGETPPSYEDVKAEDREKQHLKTKMMLCAVGAALEEKVAATSEVVEKKREVKGLGSDLKLWLVWIPLLVVVLTAMVNSNIYPIGDLISSAMNYVGNRVFGSTCKA